MGSNTGFIGEDQVSPAPWGWMVCAFKSVSLNVAIHFGRGYKQSVLVDSLMIDHDFWPELTHSVHVVGVLEKGTGLPVPVPDYFCHGCISSWLRSPFLCQSVSAFSGWHVMSNDIWQDGDALVSNTYWSRKCWEDQRCALFSIWLLNELDSMSCVCELHDYNWAQSESWVSRAQSESRVRKKRR